MKTPLLSQIIPTLPTAIAAAFVLTSCSGEDPRVAPLQAEQEAALKGAIPPFLTLDAFESEIIPMQEDRVKINFKAKVKAAEDLFISDRRLEGDIHLMILKTSQTSGTDANIYGSMHAKRTMDKWDISHPDINSGMAQLGSPRGSFDARALVDGSDEMRKFFADLEAKQAELAKAEEEQARKNEEARLALLEEKRIAKEADKKKLTEATAVGKRYRGIIVESPGGNEVRQAVEIQFTSQSGVLITAELHNPDKPSHKQVFIGELVFEQQPDANRSNNRHYPIMLSPKQVSEEFMQDRLRIYFQECVLRLEPTDQGLEGEAYASLSNSKFSLRLLAVK
jgi:hypothetical protein